jgi:hypothetical protein
MDGLDVLFQAIFGLALWIHRRAASDKRILLLFGFLATLSALALCWLLLSFVQDYSELTIYLCIIILIISPAIILLMSSAFALLRTDERSGGMRLLHLLVVTALLVLGLMLLLRTTFEPLETSADSCDGCCATYQFLPGDRPC